MSCDKKKCVHAYTCTKKIITLIVYNALVFTCVTFSSMAISCKISLKTNKFKMNTDHYKLFK